MYLMDISASIYDCKTAARPLDTIHQASDLQPDLEDLPKIREQVFLEKNFKSKIGEQMFSKIFFMLRIEER